MTITAGTAARALGSGSDEPIPLVDLPLQHAVIADEILPELTALMARGGFVGGPEVSAFEADYARFVGVRHCIGVGNGTDALEFALRAAGVGPGDEVVLPANTFVASAGAVVRSGATPVFVDCDPEFLLIDPDRIASAIGPRCRAVMPVHLYGQAAPVEAIREITDPAGVSVIEDAAQSQGARRHGRAAGRLGLAAGTSFYPGKNLGAYGDAGAVLTDDDEIARRVRRLANHGSEKKYEHPEIGFNSRLDALQAVVLRAKLRRLEAWNGARVEAAARYDGLLAGLDRVERPRVALGNDPVWHLYVIRVPHRDAVLQGLTEAGIGAGIHYPLPVPLLPAYAGLGHQQGDFPAAEAAAARIISLPLYPGISRQQQERVVSVLADVLDNVGRRRGAATGHRNGSIATSMIGRKP